ncbi:hypothetical protein ACGFS9_27200 [Streptomyces sp. NPDC048566]|uniref:hypothetical protein n=1 Tax=Streptomyces sp. NPDC048566 TaxID=3365569 RepID=UPI00371322DD
MDRGTGRRATPAAVRGSGPPERSEPDGTAGRIPLAAVLMDRDGLVSHWSGGAGRLFGAASGEALGRPVSDLLPVSGALPEEDGDRTLFGGFAAYDGLGPGPQSPPAERHSYPAAGRARLTAAGPGRVDVLWWAYPLTGPGRERLLVLAADANETRHDGDAALARRVAPGFDRRAEPPAAEELARRLPGILPGASGRGSDRIVAQILELGCPVLEYGRDDRVPVTPG